ncbi:MAG: hypothetical protein HKN20_05725 [Gemmatimonadetes bacterium]|nr:hypothetical protein [Gemmatimonadota bacterium]
MVTQDGTRAEKARVVSFLPQHRVVLAFRGEYVVAYARLPLSKGDRVLVSAEESEERTTLRIVEEPGRV